MFLSTVGLCSFPGVVVHIFEGFMVPMVAFRGDIVPHKGR
jgi:hypothetical protein